MSDFKGYTADVFCPIGAWGPNFGDRTEYFEKVREAIRAEFPGMQISVRDCTGPCYPGAIVKMHWCELTEPLHRGRIENRIREILKPIHDEGCHRVSMDQTCEVDQHPADFDQTRVMRQALSIATKRRARA